MLPIFIAEEFLEESDKYAFITDCNGRLFMLKIEKACNRVFLTTGWSDFMLASGAQIGNFMSVRIGSIDQVVIRMFKSDGMQRLPLPDNEGLVKIVNEGTDVNSLFIS